jgi:hypothetical protein
MNVPQTKPQRLQKSRPRQSDWAAGNGAKYLSYAEAWARIRLVKDGQVLERAVSNWVDAARKEITGASKSGGRS